jgi:hypothetical protein
MADAEVSKTSEGDLVWVRLPPSAPFAASPVCCRGVAQPGRAQRSGR